MAEFFLGIALDSEGVRAVVVDSEGQALGESFRGCDTDAPAPGHYEQDAQRWTRAAGAATAGAIRKSLAAPEDIAAVGLCAPSDSLVLLDEAGEPLRAAILPGDRRATDQCDQIEDIFSEDLFSITGCNNDPAHVLPKILWLGEHEGDTLKKTHTLSTAGGYLAHALCGATGIDFSAAGSFMALNVETRAWSKRVLHAFEMEGDRLPELFPATHVIGGITAEFAEASRLKKDTPVVLGAAEEQCAALGSGVVRPGPACDIIGDTESLSVVAAELFLDESRLMETRANLDSETWRMFNPGAATGSCYRWLRDHFGRRETDLSRHTYRTAYDLLNEQAGEAPPGSGGVVFLPFLAGTYAPEWNPAARGVIQGLDLSHGRAHVIRSLLEGGAYALRDVVERLRECGLEVTELRVVGGGVRSSLMEQIRAHVLQVPVVRPQTIHAAAYGAAMLAAVGAGFFDSVADAADAWVRVVRTHEPDPDLASVYDDMYQRYREIYSNLRASFDAFHGGETGE